MKKSILLFLLIPILAACQQFYDGEQANQANEQVNDNIGAALRVFTVPQGGTGAATFNSGECLVGNGTGAITTAACGAGGGVTALGELSDVATTTATVGDVLVLQADGTYDNAAQSGGFSSNWEQLFTNALTPTSTTSGIFVNASSTFNSTLRVNGVQTGANGDYDLVVGNGSNYGAISLGNVGIYSSSFSASNMNLDQAVLFRQEANIGAGNDPGIEFAWMESGNTARLLIPESAAGNATNLIRSAIVAGPYSQTIGNDMVLCTNGTWDFWAVDCDTSGTGPDFGVLDDIQVLGSSYFGETLYASSTAIGILPGGLSLAHGDLYAANNATTTGNLTVGGSATDSGIIINDIAGYSPTSVAQLYAVDNNNSSTVGTGIVIRNNSNSAGAGTSIRLESATVNATTQGGSAIKSFRTNRSATGDTSLSFGVSDGTSAGHNNELMRLDGFTGSLGVATTTPGGYFGEKLTVVGGAYFQGTATSTNLIAGTSLKLPYGSAPDLGDVGKIGIDNDNDYLGYVGSHGTYYIAPTSTRSLVIENLVAADDNISMGLWPYGVTITGIGCAYVGTGTTWAEISLEDGSGNAMTHGTPSCAAAGTNATTTPVTASNTLVSGEMLRFDVDNTPDPTTDDYTFIVEYSVTAP